MKKDHWNTLSSIASRHDQRGAYKSADLREIDMGEFQRRCREISAAAFGTDPIVSEADLDLAIQDLKQKAKSIASHMRLADAMALLHEVGMLMHGEAQR